MNDVATRIAMQTMVSDALKDCCLRQGLAAQLEQPGGILSALQLAAQALTSLPARGAAGVPAARWDECVLSGQELFSTISSSVAQCLSSNGHSRRHAAVWETLAALPIVAVMLQNTFSAAASGQQSSFSSDRLWAILCTSMWLMLQPLQAAPPLELTSAKQLGTWAAAADAALRLLPALIEQSGGDAAAKLAGVLVGQLLNAGCVADSWWAHQQVQAMPEGGSTVEQNATWAAAAAALAAVHTRA
jgi:hypothetical protein